jgi:hypothetical protein
MDGAAFGTDTFDGKTVMLIIPAAKDTILFIRQAVAINDCRHIHISP